MSKKVTFYLGSAIGLRYRHLVVTRMARATDPFYSGDTNRTAITPTVDLHLNGALTYTTVDLADNTIWQAVLTDVKTTGETSRSDVLNFHTGSLQFPGPKSEDRLSVYAMEDESSSSSSSSSQSSSSRSSLSSLSSISTSSSSSSSISTSSSSSSSISTSSNSSSSSSKSSISTSSISTSSSSSKSSQSSSSSVSSGSSSSKSSISTSSSSSSTSFSSQSA